MTEVNKDLVKIDYLQGMSYKDLSKKHDVKVNTIKAWVKRYAWAKDKAKIPMQSVPNSVPVLQNKKDKECTQGVQNKSEGTKHKKKKKGGPESKTKLDDYEPIPYIENKDLNDKQKLFCVYYIKRFNATKAYQKAYGCDYVSAMTNGSRLLSNDKIKAEIERLKADKLKGVFLSPNDILQKYIDIALSDIKDYLKFGHKKVPIIDKETKQQKLDKDGKPMYYVDNYVILNNSEEVDGSLITEVKEGKDGVSIKLMDKKAAIDFLAKYKNLLDVPTQQKLDIERRKMELAEKNSDNLDDDIEYSVEGGSNENKEEN